MYTTETISNRDDTIDIRDVIARVEELESQAESFSGEDESDDPAENLANVNAAWAQSDEGQELALLLAFLAECCGNGGDEQWRGDWYPILAIRGSHFENYAQELAEEIGAIDSSATWPNNCIDWERAARELQQDYGSVEFDGVTYWIR